MTTTRLEIRGKITARTIKDTAQRKKLAMGINKNRIEMSENVVLLGLEWFPYSTASEMASILYCDMSKATEWLGRLYKKGIVDRRDRRTDKHNPYEYWILGKK